MNTYIQKQNKKKIEQALLLLSEQFRQVHQKYGLIVEEEINGLIKGKYVELEMSKKRMDTLQNRLR